MVDPGGDRMVEHMDAAGIDLGVLLPLDWELGMGEDAPVSITRMHEMIAAVVARHPGRFIAFAGIDPQRPNALELFDWAIQTLGMRGLKLYPNTGFYPYDERVMPMYARCVDLDMPVICHTGGPGIALLRGRFANPVFLQDVLATFPTLKLWVAHAGHKIYREEAAALADVSVNTYLELSAWQHIAENDEAFYVGWLGSLRDRIGVHRILWGSDHIAGARHRGLHTLLSWIDWFRGLPERAARYDVSFTADEVDLILGGNAAACLGLEANDGSERSEVDQERQPMGHRQG
jgi:predicted TIM-barrel fold metal-dependent hydrolase